MVIVGIDIAKRSHEAVLLRKDGEVIGKSFKFANSCTGFNNLLRRIREVTTDKADVEIGMEATGHYWLPLYARLKNEGYIIRVINPVQSDALRGLYIRQTKNDSKDAFIIAEVIRFGRYTDTAVLPEDLHALRELSRHRFYIVDSVSDLKRKVIALLDQVFPEYGDFFTDTFGATSTELLLNYTTPEEIIAVDTDKLCELLNTASRGRIKQAKAEEIKEAAVNSFGIILASDSIGLLIRQYIEQIRFVERQIKEIDREIARLFQPFGTYLTTITGIGPVLAAAILSEIGDIKRFDSSAKLAAFAGIDPRVRQSGEFIGTQNKMSKRGSPYLRRAIWLASSMAVLHDPAIKAIYQRKRAEGKHHYTVIGHICRKMVSIIYAVLRDNKPYVPAVSENRC